MLTWDVFYEPADTDAPRQWIGTAQGDTMAQAIANAAQFYERPGYDLLVKRAPQSVSADFNPTLAIARYRELESLLNLELLHNPRWQAMREQGDTSFLQDSGHFAEQNRLAEEIERNGYTIVDSEDEAGNTVYGIETLE